MNEKQNNLEEIYAQIDKKQLTSSAQNPFAQRNTSIENDVQVYFNRKYLKINTKIKNIISSIQKLNILINENIININHASAQYFFDGTFPKNKDYNYEIADNILKVVDDTGVILSLSKYEKNNPVQTTVFNGEDTYEIYYKKIGFIDRLMNKSPKIKRIEKINYKGEITDVLNFYSDMLDDYIQYKEGKKCLEIDFDNDPMSLKYNSMVPKKYIMYDENEIKIEKLSYLYSIPYEYKEYCSKLQKPIKIFKLHGLKNSVYKYIVYGEKTGNLISVYKF